MSRKQLLIELREKELKDENDRRWGIKRGCPDYWQRRRALIKESEIDELRALISYYQSEDPKNKFGEDYCSARVYSLKKKLFSVDPIIPKWAELKSCEKILLLDDDKHVKCLKCDELVKKYCWSIHQSNCKMTFSQCRVCKILFPIHCLDKHWQTCTKK